MLGLPSNIGFRKGIFVTAKEIMTSIETSAPIGITAKTRGMSASAMGPAASSESRMVVTSSETYISPIWRFPMMRIVPMRTI